MRRPNAAGVSRGEGETILVVEDEHELRHYTTETLRELGYVVLEAPDGQGALDILRRHPEISFSSPMLFWREA